jgi:hypothetical protein
MSLRNTFVFVLVASWLIACAANQVTEPVESTGDASASGSALPPLEKKCKYERGNRAGSRLQRVCRYVDESQAPENL